MTEQALARPEFIRQSLDTKTYGVVEKPLSLFERIYEQNWLRKIFILVLLAAAWQAYATWVNNVLLFPTLSETFDALIDAIRSGGLLRRAWFSISLLLQGYAIGLLLAAIFTGAAVGTRIGQDLLETLTAMFNPLPAIALLPLSLLWFGLGNASLIFVLIH
jgi:NitT/TauT family transport system permease protein